MAVSVVVGTSFGYVGHALVAIAVGTIATLLTPRGVMAAPPSNLLIWATIIGGGILAALLYRDRFFGPEITHAVLSVGMGLFAGFLLGVSLRYGGAEIS